jgi:site-specific DNA-methyltransferase (adenine-specific)
MLEINKIYFEDCLVGMQGIDDKSIDMILCDLPYGTTHNKWDTIIPIDKLWLQYEKIIKNNGAIILTATQPFSSFLVTSNIKLFKYEWIWVKSKVTGYLNAKKQPMRKTESILVFYKNFPIYNPQMKKVKERFVQRSGGYSRKGMGYNDHDAISSSNGGLNYPNNVLEIKSSTTGLHPTEKPVELFEYFIKTYSNENELVLDNCIGSGTTAIACLNTNRNYIGFENDPKYFEIANQRILEHKEKLNAL